MECVINSLIILSVVEERVWVFPYFGGPEKNSFQLSHTINLIWFGVSLAVNCPSPLFIEQLQILLSGNLKVSMQISGACSHIRILRDLLDLYKPIKGLCRKVS